MNLLIDVVDAQLFKAVLLGKKLMWDMKLLVGVVDAQLFKAVLLGRNWWKILNLLWSFFHKRFCSKTKSNLVFWRWIFIKNIAENSAIRETQWRLFIFQQNLEYFSEKFILYFGCGAAQIEVRRPAVRQAWVRIPARHPNRDPSTERKRWRNLERPQRMWCMCGWMHYCMTWNNK